MGTNLLWLDTPVIIGFAVYSLITGCLCFSLAEKKGYSGYFWTGLLLGVLGLLYVIGLPILNGTNARKSKEKRVQQDSVETVDIYEKNGTKHAVIKASRNNMAFECPFCSESLSTYVEVCPQCNANFHYQR